MARNVREAEVAALEEVGQLGVVHAEEVEHRRVQVVDVERVLRGGVAQLVRGAVADAALDPPPASQTEKPLMGWSRPLPWAIGVRERIQAELVEGLFG